MRMLSFRRWMAWATYLRPKAMNKNSQSRKGSLSPFWEFFPSERYLVVRFHQANLGKHLAARHAVIGGLHIGHRVPVRDGDHVQNGGSHHRGARSHPSWGPGGAGTPRASWNGK